MGSLEQEIDVWILVLTVSSNLFLLDAAISGNAYSVLSNLQRHELDLWTVHVVPSPVAIYDLFATVRLV